MSQKPRKLQRVSKACKIPTLNCILSSRLAAIIPPNCTRKLGAHVVSIGDFCNRRSIKCGRSADPLGRCQNCADFDVPCTFDRPAKRRGVKAGTRASMRETPLVETPTPENVLSVPPTGRMSNSSVPRSYSESAHRPSLTGDPWSTFNVGGVATEVYDDDGALRNSWNAFAIASDRQIRNLVQVYFEIVYPMYELSLLLSCYMADQIPASRFSTSNLLLKELITKSTSEIRGCLPQQWQSAR